MIDEKEMVNILENYNAIIAENEYNKKLLSGEFPDDEQQYYAAAVKKAERTIDTITMLLAALPPRESEVIRRRYVLNADYKSIAGALQLDISAVFKRRKKAVLRMVDIWNRLHG